MKRETRLTEGQQQHGETTPTHASQQGEVRFASPEEALRRDLQEIVVPPRIAERLDAAIAREPVRELPWWKRLFRR